MRKLTKHQRGLSLLEILLVTAIMGGMLLMLLKYSEQQAMSMKVDRAAEQMQELLAAGASYYVYTNKPPEMSALQMSGYIPSIDRSPWNTAYTMTTTPNKQFVISLRIPSSSENALQLGMLVAGKLPSSAVLDQTAAGYILVTTQINLPNQSLNNADSVHFAGLFKHGGCVPMPVCPVDDHGQPMQASVFVVPVSISGLNDANTTNVYPLSSFSTYATVSKPANNDPPPCTAGKARPACNGLSPSGHFWRACAKIVTERGEVSETNSSMWGQYITLGAFVRCAKSQEPTGSGFHVFSDR